MNEIELRFPNEKDRTIVMEYLEEHYKIIESNLELSIQNDSLIRLDVNKLRKEIRRNRDSYK